MSADIVFRSRNYDVEIRDFMKGKKPHFADLDIKDEDSVITLRCDSLTEIYEIGKKIALEAEILINQETREADKIIGDTQILTDYEQAKARV